ncbi:hypothetical protein FJZ41_02590 [Candidatus Shapirobacteria bacterium]|nr:hypothetical protein [Candidatus Shapirobacteria bacterium]
MGETRRDKFKRLATNRTKVVLNALRLLGNLSNRANYDYSDEDLAKIFRAIEEQLRIVKAKFQSKLKREFKL